MDCAHLPAIHPHSKLWGILAFSREPYHREKDTLRAKTAQFSPFMAALNGAGAPLMGPRRQTNFAFGSQPTI
jgi:hypothetical protein